MIQFGYVICFSVVLSLTSSLCLMNDLMSIRLEAYKIILLWEQASACDKKRWKRSLGACIEYRHCHRCHYDSLYDGFDKQWSGLDLNLGMLEFSLWLVRFVATASFCKYLAHFCILMNNQYCNEY